MDRFKGMRVFLMVADAGGFAPAAKRLGMSAPAVTRAIAALEDHLGARLFKRTTRLVRLTEAGERYYANSKRLLAALDEADASAADAHSGPCGQITVTAPLTFGRMFVAPVVMEFLARYPRTTATTNFVDRIVDLIEEGVDVAVRVAPLPDSSLSAISVGTSRRIVCASPAYLAERGVPKTPAELARMDAIDFAVSPPSKQWVFKSKGAIKTVRPQARLTTDSVDVAIAAAVAGCGVARLLSYQIRSELQSGTLELVLTDFEPPPVPIHVIHVDGQNASKRVRAFVDFAVERLRTELSRDGG